MKRLLIALTLLAVCPNFAWACDHYTRAYNTATTIDFILYKLDGTGLKTDAVSATHDIKIMKDEGAEADTTADAFTDRGQGYSTTLTATETTAARITLYIVDQSSPQVWLDKCLIIETYGNASAQFPDQSAALLATTISELSSLPSMSAPTVGQILRWLYQYGTGAYKTTTTSTVKTLKKDDTTTTLGTCTVSDDGTTFTRGECS